MKNLSNLFMGVLLTLFIISCSGKEAFVISRTLLGYIPPPDVTTIMSQLEEELERCEKTGGTHCEKQAMDYVRIVNPSLERKPLTGVVVITRVEDGIEAEYFPDKEQENKPVEDQKESIEK